MSANELVNLDDQLQYRWFVQRLDKVWRISILTAYEFEFVKAMRDNLAMREMKLGDHTIVWNPTRKQVNFLKELEMKYGG